MTNSAPFIPTKSDAEDLYTLAHGLEGDCHELKVDFNTIDQTERLEIYQAIKESAKGIVKHIKDMENA